MIKSFSHKLPCENQFRTIETKPYGTKSLFHEGCVWHDEYVGVYRIVLVEWVIRSTSLLIIYRECTYSTEFHQFVFFSIPGWFISCKQKVGAHCSGLLAGMKTFMYISITYCNDVDAFVIKQSGFTLGLQVRKIVVCYKGYQRTPRLQNARYRSLVGIL